MHNQSRRSGAKVKTGCKTCKYGSLTIKCCLITCRIMADRFHTDYVASNAMKGSHNASGTYQSCAIEW